MKLYVCEGEAALPDMFERVFSYHKVLSGEYVPQTTVADN